MKVPLIVRVQGSDATAAMEGGLSGGGLLGEEGAEETVGRRGQRDGLAEGTSGAVTMKPESVA